MRRLTRCLATSLVLVAAPLAACGSDDDAPERAEAVDEGTTTTDASARHVDPRAALLTLDDLPPGYAVDDSGGSEEDTPFGCEELEGMDVSAADDARTAEVAFTGGEAGPLIFHGVADQDEGTAAREFDNTRAALRKPECRTFSETDEQGRTVTWTLEPLRIVSVGDDTLAFRLTGDAGVFAMSFDVAVERIGDNVSVVGTARAPMGPPPPDLSALVRRAHEKLAGAAA